MINFENLVFKAQFKNFFVSCKSHASFLRYSNFYISNYFINFKIKTSRWGHPLSTYPKFSGKRTFLTSWYAHVPVCIMGLEILVFQKIYRAYLMVDPIWIVNQFVMKLGQWSWERNIIFSSNKKIHHTLRAKIW